MAGCALTQDFNLNADCRDAIGGIKIVHVIEIGNVLSVTEASGMVTAITKATGTIFRKYTLIRATSHADDALTVNEQNGSIFSAQSVEIIMNKRNANARNEIMIMGRVNLAFVVTDNNGKSFLYGREFGLTMGAGTGATGTAWGDRNGYTLPFAGNERELAPEVDDATMLTLQTPGA
jgi:hypothetical protein